MHALALCLGIGPKTQMEHKDYTEWARETVEKALTEAKPCEAPFMYRMVLEQLQHYLNKAGVIRPGIGIKIPLQFSEMQLLDSTTQSLRALGFSIQYTKLSILDRYEYFVTKYE